MVRSIAGVIVGYLVMFFLVFAGLSGAYVAMGADRAFQPGTYDVSVLWIGVMLVVGLVAALLGGAACSMISGRRRAVTSLANVVLVLGLMMLVPVLMGKSPPAPGPREPGTSNLQAMTRAQQPVWAMVVNPAVGFLGTMVGGLVLRPPADARSAKSAKA